MEKYLEQDYWKAILENLVEWAVQVLPSLVLLVVVFIVTLKIINYFVGKLKKLIIERAKKSEPETITETEKRINTLMNILKGTAKIILWIMFVMIFLKKINLDIGPLLAGAGIVGLAVGFGAQELVRDFISGFFILLENQIREGDVAIIDGKGGLVERIELRTITLRDLSGVVHVFQNGKINTLSNMTKEWSAMVLDIGVAYKENSDKVMEVMREVGDKLKNDPDFADNFIDSIEIFGVDQFGDSAVVVKARLKTKPGMQWATGREYRKRLKIAFDEQNIEIPFPHTTLYWGEATKAMDININAGDIPKQEKQE
jgi:small conductance mechanosensitive channel